MGYCVQHYHPQWIFYALIFWFALWATVVRYLWRGHHMTRLGRASMVAGLLLQLLTMAFTCRFFR